MKLRRKGANISSGVVRCDYKYEENEKNNEIIRKRQSQKKKKRTIICHKCGRTGHTKRDCRQLRQNITTCNYCKKIGHVENDCWTKRNKERNNDKNTQEITYKETEYS